MLITEQCIRASLCCTPQLREELSKLSFQTLHSSSEIFKETDQFWYLSQEIVEMLEKWVSRDYSNYGETVTN